MKLHEIEIWARRAIARLERKEQQEDALVEYKASWPQPRWTARQLAGHANAARGADILWVIGVDQEHGVVGALDTEAGDWWNELKSEFDGGVAPGLMGPISFDHGSVSVVAMAFSTSRPPYVIRNPRRGGEKAGPFSLDTPWRDGSATRSAGRSELLLLLQEQASLPTVEVLGILVIGTTVHREQPTVPAVVPTAKELATNWRIECDLYITHTGDQVAVVPFHRGNTTISTADGTVLVECRGVTFETPPLRYRNDDQLAPSGIRVAPSELLVSGSGSARIAFNAIDERTYRDQFEASLILSMELTVAGQPLPIAFSVEVPRSTRFEQSHVVGRWERT